MERFSSLIPVNGNGSGRETLSSLSRYFGLNERASLRSDPEPVDFPVTFSTKGQVIENPDLSIFAAIGSVDH